MKHVLLALGLILVVGSLGFSSQGGAKIKILPFKVWKQKKIDEAKTIVAELKRQNKRSYQLKSIDSDDEEKQGVAQQLSQAELNLGVVRALSANDYFLLYVSPQFKGNNEAFLQAAKALSPRDMADILSAYQKHMAVAEITSSADPSEPEQDPSISEKTTKSP